MIGMIGGVQEHLDLRACLADQRVLCKALIHFLRLLRYLRTPRDAWLPTQPSNSGGPQPHLPLLEVLTEIICARSV